MTEEFTILIDRLKEGQVQKLTGSYNPAFLQIDEPELQFRSPVSVKGEAYLTDTDLIIHLKANTLAKMPCAVCNQMFETEVKIESFYHAQPIAEIPSHVFDFSESLREALLIELPRYVECSKGKCPERATMTPYLKPEERQEKSTYFPFSDIDLNKGE